ncbi:MAG: hypothetical protein HY899_16100 [Deltaproteobacteria bacterium]|nr:hypothetical protein [Deltaproteobacteria bacterium]
MIKNDALRDMATQLFGMTEAEMNKVTPEMEEELLNTAEVVGNYRLVAEVVSARCCFAGCQPGQKIVVDNLVQVNARESTAPLCLGVLGPLMDKSHVLADRMNHKGSLTAHMSGLRCVDPGLDLGGLGTVEFTVRVEKR